VGHVVSDLPDSSLLRSFLVLGQELNFRRAAERLGVDQSALSRRIQKLEAELRYRLFERTTHEVAMTPAGLEFYQSATRLLSDYRSAIDHAALIAEGRRGKVRIGYMSFAAPGLMPRAVRRFERIYPDVLLELRYLHTQKQKVALANDDIDVGYMIGPYDNPDYHTVTLSRDRLFLLMPADHRFLVRETVAPASIADMRLILGDISEWGEYRHRLEDMFGGIGISLRASFEASNTLGLLGLVASGLGVTVYPESLLGLIGDGIQARPIDHPDFSITTVLVWKRINRSRSVRNFTDIARLDEGARISVSV